MILTIPLTETALHGLAAGGAAGAEQTQIPSYAYHMWNGGWHFWFLGPIMMLFFIVIAVVAVVLVLRWLLGPGHSWGHHSHPPPTPLDILKERFARGEIDKEEFEERRKLLER